MKNFELNLSGLNELGNDLTRLRKEYPDAVDEKLEKLGKKFVKEVKAITPSSPTEHRHKLKKSYKVSKAIGLGNDARVEITTTAPHFHLVEHGHELIRKGKNIGRVEGKHMMDQTKKRYEQIIPREAETMINELLKRNNL